MLPMKLDIPLQSAVTITIDPVRKVLSITDDDSPDPSPGYVASRHVWNKADGTASALRDHGRDASPRLAPPAAALIGRLITRKLTWAGMLAGVCFLSFMYARHSGPSAHPAPQGSLAGSLAVQQVPSSLKLPSPPRADGTPPAAAASPNAAFGLD